jgi:hypothetical protein
LTARAPEAGGRASIIGRLISHADTRLAEQETLESSRIADDKTDEQNEQRATHGFLYSTIVT